MRLVLCGGGTGGHIIPNVALIHELKERYPQQHQLELLYIGSGNTVEKSFLEELQIPYQGIICGKLRRYFSLKNFIDFFRIPIGMLQAFLVLRRFKPQVIFCKGGYVSFPVAFAGKLLKIPVLLHESDVTPGLANRLSARFATAICLSFSESKKYFPHKKIILTGNPVRRELAFGNKEDGLKFTDFKPIKPVLFFMGGSQGAEFINQIVFQNLDYLLSHYQIVHICGAGKVKEARELLKLLSPAHQKYLSRYRAFPFVGRELKDLYALADLIICRAGALTLAEIDFFTKPSLLIPLPGKSSRGDQIDNAKVFAKNHLCRIVLQEEFTNREFMESIKSLLSVKKAKSSQRNKFLALEKIVHLLEKYAKQKT
jgi:UDP-N-acetylglucosamine--N-acetylmuramyl-(pentapeptide) pyrophosphoryl-undecaprenol N-acetylglucosamine transferase